MSQCHCRTSNTPAMPSPSPSGCPRPGTAMPLLCHTSHLPLLLATLYEPFLHVSASGHTLSVSLPPSSDRFSPFPAASAPRLSTSTVSWKQREQHRCLVGAKWVLWFCSFCPRCLFHSFSCTIQHYAQMGREKGPAQTGHAKGPGLVLFGSVSPPSRAQSRLVPWPVAR